MRFIATIVSLVLLSGTVFAQDRLQPAKLPVDLGTCYAPTEPFPYKLEKSDPLYETARDEHQRHLEELEDYVNCLDRERSVALSTLRNSFDLFMSNFGKDAVLKYAKEKGVNLE